MSRNYKSFFCFLILLSLNFFSVLEEDKKLEIKSGTAKFENLIFFVPQGSQHTGELLIANLSDKDLNLILYLAPDEKTNLTEAIKKKEQ